MDNQNNVIFSCEGISKTFGGVRALKDVRLEIRKGEVHALLGENGAGKSTLMKIVIGLYSADKGTMFFDGAPYVSANPAKAAEKGISMIHQELNVEPKLTIAENIFLHREDRVKGTMFLKKRLTNQKAQELLTRFGIPYSPKQEMGTLNIAQSQMIEIIRAVSSGAKMIIMDEPTSSLDSEETRKLFQIIRDLRSQGVSIIYISHRMEEIFEICDRVSVFRDGEYIITTDLDKTNKAELISYMVGHEVSNVFPKVDCPIGDVVLKVEGLTGKGFSDISFEVRAGEILGFSGLVGSGRSETMKAIFGLDPYTSGKVFLDGKEIHNRSSKQAIARGFAMVNEDRKEYGLCLFRPIRENVALPRLTRGPLLKWIRTRTESQDIRQITKKLSLKASSIEANVYSLSGGNQQKVVFSKWMLLNPKVLILDEPTRGVDVGAKAEIHTLVSQAAMEGMAVILVSSELPEIMGMSDRIIVYHEGRINGEVTREELLSETVTQENLLALAFGEKR